MNVSVLGASDKRERYSYMAVKMLAEKGHTVFPIHPLLDEIDGIRVFKRLADVPSPIHTVTVYLSPGRSTPLASEIASVRPRRVIFNPGAENDQLARRLSSEGIPVLEACTLVLLRTNQFDTAGVKAPGP
jgi:predicted CoA-binding protein